MARNRIALLEYFARVPGSGHTARHDEDSDIIPGVKIIGFKSKNHRFYTPQALKEAVPLYEGIAVYDNHPTDSEGRPKPTKSRTNADRIGKLINVRFLEETGLVGDLVVLRTHPLADSLMEAANDPNKHDFFTLSHNADGQTRDGNDGTLIIEKIVKARSVDLVQGGATTETLYENSISLFECIETQGSKRMKFHAILESLSRHKDVPAWKRKMLMEMPEDEMLGGPEDPGMAADYDVDMDDTGEMPAGNPEEILDAAFCEAIKHIVDSDMSVEEKKKKISAYLDHQEKVTSESAPDKSKKSETTEEQHQHNQTPGTVALTEDHARSLCQKYEVPAKPQTIRALTESRDITAALSLIEELSDMRSKPKSYPRSGGTNRNSGNSHLNVAEMKKRVFSKI